VKYFFAVLLITSSLHSQELSKVVQNDKLSESDRWSAIISASKKDGAMAIPVLEGMLNQKKYSWYTRTAIAQGLVVVGGPGAIKVLQWMLEDRSLVVRTVVVDALGDMKDPASLTPLTEEMKNKRNFIGEQSLWIRKHLVDAIAKTGQKKSIPVLITYLDDPDTEVAERAKKNLSSYVKMDGKSDWSKRNWIDWWMSSGSKL
jgi:HEAT repeat protein